MVAPRKAKGKTDQVARTPLNVKGGSYTAMLKNFERVKQNIPNSVSDVDKSFHQMIKIEAQAARLSRAMQNPDSKFNQTTDSIARNASAIQVGIDLLGKKASTAPLQPDLQQKFAPLQAELRERGEQRQAIITQIKNANEEKDKKFQEAVQAILTGKPKTQVADILKSASKLLSDVETSMEKLDTNNDLLQRKLGDLARTTKNTLQTPSDQATMSATLGVDNDETPRPE